MGGLNGQPAQTQTVVRPSSSVPNPTAGAATLGINRSSSLHWMSRFCGVAWYLPSYFRNYGKTISNPARWSLDDLIDEEGSPTWDPLSPQSMQHCERNDSPLRRSTWQKPWCGFLEFTRSGFEKSNLGSRTLLGKYRYFISTVILCIYNLYDCQTCIPMFQYV